MKRLEKVIVVNSYSLDRTVDIARTLDCEVVQHEFENYSEQRNWAQAYATLGPEDWVLHLDSDEIVAAQLAESMCMAIAENSPETDGYLVHRLSYFLERPIRFGHINPS